MGGAALKPTATGPSPNGATMTTTIKVGDPAWILDTNRRGYVRPDGTRSGPPLRAEMWRDAVIVAETTRSWVVVRAELGPHWECLPAHMVRRVPKRAAEGIHNGVALRREVVDDDIFAADHLASIVYAVRRSDAAQLRRVAAAIGYPVPE